MEKVTFGSLVIEVTHRCNMHCAHCLRGEAENIDISIGAIDSLLDQTEAIYDLLLSGGEPCLNIEALEYIANGIEKRGIKLFGADMITNGTIFDPRVIKVMKQFYRLVTQSKRDCGLRYDLQDVQLGFSFDKYHERQDLAKENMIKYENAGKGTYSIAIKQCGNDPFPRGRGKNLEEAKKVVDYGATPLAHMSERRVEVLCCNDKIYPLCPVYHNAHIYDKRQHMILCKMAMLPDGTIINTCGSDYESYDSWTPVCNVTKANIWDSIIDYNKQRLTCPEWVELYWPDVKKLPISAFGGNNNYEVSEDYNRTYREQEKKIKEQLETQIPLLSLMKEDSSNVIIQRWMFNSLSRAIKEQFKSYMQPVKKDSPVELADRAAKHDYENYKPAGSTGFPCHVCCPY